jgi:2-polyprenyl-3-methyl-5-hydroxy-6-metoxy-1,4-benzoquinol methylase
VTEYVLSRRGAEELERARLRLLEQKHDPLTMPQLDAIGVGPGWRCLDVGAGGGSVTRMLAERVGSTGSVLATDLDVRLLEPLASDRVEILRHDLLAEPLPEAAFDLVHTRLVLMHVPARVQALRRLAGAVRPGGWLAIMDVDFTSVEISPTSRAWERSWSAFCDAVVAGGWDLRYGARLYPDLCALGLAEVTAEYVTGWSPGGSLQPQLLSLTFERLRERMRAAGAADEDIDQGRALLGDAEVAVHGPTNCVATARRPQAPP